MLKWLKGLFILALLFGVGLSAAGIWLIQDLEKWSLSPIKVTTPVQVDLQSGTSLNRLSTSLQSKGLVSSDWRFQLWVRFNGSFQRFQKGLYEFNGDVTPASIEAKMVKGDIFIPFVLSVVIPEGFTLKQLADRLEANKVASKSEVLKFASNRNFIKQLGIDAATLEGFTFPATYTFKEMPTAESFLKKTVYTFFERLPRDFTTQLAAKKMSLTQAVTFASLIELETMREEEKPMVSEVIWNRLKTKNQLGIDAALIYGIPNYQGDITWAHLKDKSNPYNTRIHRGLPPTPIGAVSMSSLKAVLTPTNYGYMYYVVDGKDRTKHIFTKTSQQHNTAVNEYLKSLKENPPR
jgi:UPF0755 protein